MIVRIHADDAGETRLTRLDLPDGPSEVDATSVTLRRAARHAQSHGLEPSARRQLLVILGGEMVVGSSDGDSERLGPGDALWEDDHGTRGHSFEDVGDQTLTLLLVALTDDAVVPRRGE